jgi:hypothetical protein
LAIPWKLPGPLVGTALQADPNCAGAAESLLGEDSLVGADSADVVAGAADAEFEPLSLLPQADMVAAAAVMATAATIFLIRTMSVPLEGCDETALKR